MIWSQIGRQKVSQHAGATKQRRLVDNPSRAFFSFPGRILFFLPRHVSLSINPISKDFISPSRVEEERETIIPRLSVRAQVELKVIVMEAFARE